MKQPKPPDLRTWDFSDCEADEVTACLYYECAREVPAVIAQIRAGRYGLRKVAGFGVEVAASRFPEFPRKPWLALDPKARKEFLHRATHPWHLGYGATHPDDALLMNEGAIPELVRRLQQQYEMLGAETPENQVGIIRQGDRPASWVVLNLNWTKSDRQLKADFARFLKRRPKQFRSKHSGRKNHRDLLHGLTAKRLMEFCRAKALPNPPEASLQMWKSSCKKGCPYGEERALRASVRKVKTFIRKEFLVAE